MTQDTEDVVARVANAIWAETNYAHEGSVVAEFGELLDQHEHDKERAFRQARAALEASDRQSLSDRIDGLEADEPSEAMICAGGSAVLKSAHLTGCERAKLVYAAMRAALHQEGIAPE